jgi:HAMP domain-containing protein
MQITTNTASHNISEQLSHLSERLILARQDRVITTATATNEEKSEFITHMLESVDFEWLGLYDPHGQLINGSRGSPENISERMIYTLIHQSNDLSMEDTSLGNTGLEVVVGLPIHREWLSSIYLVGSYRFNSLTELLRNIRIGENCIAFVISSSGNLIAHIDTDMLINGRYLTEELGSDSEVEQILSMMMQSQEGTEVLLSTSNPMYISYIPIQGTNWSLGLITFRDEFTSAFISSIINSVILGVVVLIVAMVLFRFLLLRVLTNPLHKITDNAKSMAAGRFDANALESISGRTDEIGQLGKGFNIVSGSVHHVISDISDCIFYNASLSNLFIRHRRYNMNRTWLPNLITSGQSDELPQEVQVLFTEKSDNEGIFNTDVVISGDNEDDSDSSYYYSLTLKRVEIKQTSIDDADDFICVMLLLTDTKPRMPAMQKANSSLI